MKYYELWGWDKLLVWRESLPIHLVYLCQPPMWNSHFWCPWVGWTLQHPPYQEENPRSGLAVGGVAELWPSLNLPNLVALGGKWLPFSWVGGIPTPEREPHWWHTNRVPNNVTRTRLPWIKWFMFISCQGLCTHNKWPYPEFQLTATNFMSMAAKSSNLVDKMSWTNLQTEGHADVPTQSAKDPQEPEEEDSSPCCSPSWCLALRPPSSCPNTKYCLEIWVTLTEELGAIPPPSHSWMAPLVEDMLHNARTGLTKAVMTGPGRAVLFYRRCSMGEGLMADEAIDATFLLTGAGMWVGKSTYLTADPMTIQEGKRAIAQAVTDCQIKARGPGHPHVNLPAQQPFWFNPLRSSPLKDMSEDGSSHYPPSPHWPTRGWEHNRHWRDQGPQSPLFPSPSPDCGFESDRSSLSTMSSRSDGSRHSRWGRWDREKTHMKINLPIFKDKDAKDVVTYQSWRWDLTMYQCAGCRDCTLLPYVIRSLQGYPGELVWSSGTDINLDDMLTILDEHYNNVKVLDALNQELFQLWMADKETVLDWGICLPRHLQVLAAAFPDHFSPDHIAELKRDHFYGRLPKWLKAMLAYLKVVPQVRTYSDYLRATREAEKEDSIEFSQSSRVQAANSPSKLRTTSFFPLRKLKGNQPLSKKPTVHI